jgi:hypothetical protein
LRSFLQGWRDKALGIFSVTNTERAKDPIVQHYDRLERYYLNSGVYDRLSNVDDETGAEIAGTVALRALRNPANRVTEFYASKLDPTDWLETVEYGDESVAREDAITAALTKVETWSNWQQEGRTGARQYGWAGDLFTKVATREDMGGVAAAVYFERMDPRYVKDFDKDERGFFTYLRISTPKSRRNEEKRGELVPYTQTEIWDKEEQLYCVYEKQDHGVSDSEEDLGELVLEQSLTEQPNGAPDGFTGYNFIPVVHAKFRDVGKERGLPAFGHAIGMIRECDRIATKLHEMLFPDVTWVLQRNAVGPDGNPLPPMVLEDNRDSDPLELPTGQYWARGYDRTTYARDDAISVGRDRITRLPSGGSLEPKIPNRNMQPALDALAAQVEALKQDLPESRYGELPDIELSGRAIRYAYAAVYDRFNEAFANLSAAKVRLDNMALTIGQVVGLEGFSVTEIGEYGESGEAFEHSYLTPDPFPNSRWDEAEADLAEAQALAAFKELGPEPYRKALEASEGWTEEEAAAEAARAQHATQQLTSVQSTTNLIEQALAGDNPPQGE